MDILILLPVSYVNPLTSSREILMDVSSVSVKSVFNGKTYDVEWMYNNTMLILDAVESNSALNVKRKRRSIGNAQKNHYNHYLQRIIEADKMISNEKSLRAKLNDENMFDSNDRSLADLPYNRTIYFHCNSFEMRFCLQGRLSVENFNANDSPILITVNFTLNLGNINKITTDSKDVMVFRSSIEVSKTLNENV